MTALAVTGAGIVGHRVIQFLRASHGRDVRVLDPRVDHLDDLTAGDTVVFSHPGPHVELAGRLVRRGVSVISVDDGLDDNVQLADLDDAARAAGASLVVGAGLCPALAGLLARHLAGQLAEVDEVHVAFHGTAGPACARQHHRALRGRAVGWHDGAWIERPAGSGRELCWFPEPIGPLDCYRAELSAPVLFHRVFPNAARISARVSATRRDRLTARLPMLRQPHPEGLTGALRVEVRGRAADGSRSTVIAGLAELVGTVSAATAAVLADAAVGRELPDGVVIGGDERLATTTLLHRLEQHGVRLQEFTGVPHV